jgi:ribonuclease BN (tRNA processing enzyme)
MKFQLLPSTFDENGTASARQHLACFVIDDAVAIDAGSLATASTKVQQEQIRDVVLTHAHLDHIAGLPLFVDDLFASLREPIYIYATSEVVEILERDIFNWNVYPRFSELKNDFGVVLKYKLFEIGREFSVKHLSFKPISVNHKVPSVGFVVSDGKTSFAISGDTAEMKEFWLTVNNCEKLDAVLIECAFPNELESLAHESHHLTPKTLKSEIVKLQRKTCPIYIINMKPKYREEIIGQIADLGIENLQILEVGKIYHW